MAKMVREGKEQGKQEDRGNNKSVIGRTAGHSNNYQRQTHICKSFQVKF